jgi:hypothetical protein
MLPDPPTNRMATQPVAVKQIPTQQVPDKIGSHKNINILNDSNQVQVRQDMKLNLMKVENEA